jgi:hypothetical protein
MKIEGRDIHLLIISSPLLQLLLIFIRRITRIFNLGILTAQRGAASVFDEKLLDGLVTADFHETELVPFPLVEHCGADEGDVNAEIAVVRRAIETEVDCEWDGGPGWIFATAVEADLDTQLADTRFNIFLEGWQARYFVRGLRFQLLEYLLRCCFVH